MGEDINFGALAARLVELRRQEAARLAREGKSLRTIAALLGVSHVTVSADLRASNIAVVDQGEPDDPLSDSGDARPASTSGKDGNGASASGLSEAQLRSIAGRG